MGARACREMAEREKKTRLDLLRKLPNDLGSRIFELVGLGVDGHSTNSSDISRVKDLLACGLVSMCSHHSATIICCPCSSPTSQQLVS